jgi:predicted MFS family arabinose efflux permease
MSRKTGYFVLEGLNAFATSLYFNYLFFYTQSRFGFGNLQNLLLSALNGFIYMSAAWFGGRVAQRYGYHRALKFGVLIMAVMLVAGAGMDTTAGLLLTLAGWTFGVCFTWPTLEALTSEGESASSLPRLIGRYNLVWAAGTAVAYFCGGVILEKLGMKSLFWVPAALHLAQLGLLLGLEHRAAAAPGSAAAGPECVAPEVPVGHRSAGQARLFLRLAWLANPFAYVAINTVVAVIPGLARHHHLSPMLAGFFCSVWLFARMGAFLGLWLWPGWHYRFGWFLTAYLLLIVSFATMLLSSVLWPVLLAQVAFGAATGLLYYASLFYSMDVGETKGEHGGLHETAIGAGIFGGPAVGAAALHFFPAQPNAGAWGVSALLLVGLAAFLAVRWRARPTRPV